MLGCARFPNPAPQPPLAMTESANAFPDALPIGTRLDDFVVSGVIGAGGFGTVYLAREETLDRTVAIKEYLPSAIAARAATQTVVPRSQSHREGYVAGLQSFMREARLQAQFSHPALLEVYRVWEQNGTAYMAMRYYPGTSLRELRKAPDVAAGLDEEQIRGYLQPVCDAVRELHQQNVLHRDVSPDNILIMPNGAPVLLDFGAARTVVAGATQSLTTVLKPGYAPIEQYADDGSLEQGPWTDVYGLGAVMYFLAMGGPPPQAINRMMFDNLTAFDDATRGRYSAMFVAAVKRALAVRPDDRFRSVDALCAALGWTPRTPLTRLQTHIVPPAEVGDASPPSAAVARAPSQTPPSGAAAQADACPAPAVEVAPAAPPVSARAAKAQPRRRTGMGAALGAIVLAALAVGVWQWMRPNSASDTATTPKAAAPEVTPTSAPVTPSATPSAPTAPATSAAPVSGGNESKSGESPGATPAPAPVPAPRTEPSPGAAAAPGKAPVVSSDTSARKAPSERTSPATRNRSQGDPAADPAAERDTVANPVPPPRPSRDADCDRLMAKLSLGTVDLNEAEHARLRACR